MISMSSAMLHAINTMKNTIDDADYIINWSYVIIVNQLVIYFGHSHSIVAGGFLEIS